MSTGFLEQMATFTAIARTGSITAAGTQLGLPQPTVSRHLAALEARLGAPLVRRSTRALTLTEEGLLFLERAQAALEAADDALAALSAPAKGFGGRLRVSCSHAFAHRILIPALASWQRQQPEVQIELLPSDGLDPLVAEGIDVALRIGPLSDSGLVARRIGQFERVLVASRDYLARHPAPVRPEQLRDHQCLALAGGSRAPIWSLRGPDGAANVRPAGRLTIGTMEGLRSAVLADLGIAATPAWFWGAELAAGRVVRVLPQWQLPRQPLSALTAARPARTSREAAFIDFVERAFAPHDTSA